MAHGGDDAFVFLDETSSCFCERTQAVWQVLLVDDEPDVHAATKLALKDVQIQGRRLAFSHAYSAAQARELLAQRQDFAAALIDVVMESEDAGLQLVRYIRERQGNHAMRIILRTGQPGYAPEIDTIQRYDINDYKTKSELTQVRLYTSLTMALRSYEQICQLEAGRRGLEQILAATTELGRPAGLQKFASGLVTQLCALLGVDDQCLVCAVMHAPDRQPYVLAAAGGYGAWIGMPLHTVPLTRVRERLLHTLHARQHCLADGASLFFQGPHMQSLAAFIDVSRPLDEIERGLLEVFCSSISVAFENLQLYQDINELAYTDAQVHLPNRNALTAALERSTAQPGVVALIDIDGFADINSVLDDSFGDTVLHAVAYRLRTVFDERTLVARLGGDVFGLYGTAQTVTPERIAQVFAQPFAMRGGELLRLSATGGLAHHEPGASGSSVLKHASAALKQAKRFARGKSLYFEAGQAEAARERMHLLNRLRASFSEQHLFLNYQPLVHLQSGCIVGAECLLRWKGVNGRMVPPDQFIPIAEQSGLMVPIGDWVVRTALQWRLRLQDRVDAGFRVAINVSHVQFVEPDFVDRFLTMLDEAGVPGTQVEIELTESVAIENTAQLAAKLRQLRARGVRVAMDDFGTGYSSLSILQRLALDQLKIDRSFISGMPTEDGSSEIVRTIVTLAQHLRLATVAEGIETEAQRQAVLALGCEVGQGYLFARPMGEAEFAQWLLTQTLPASPA